MGLGLGLGVRSGHILERVFQRAYHPTNAVNATVLVELYDAMVACRVEGVEIVGLWGQLSIRLTAFYQESIPD